MLLLLTSLTAHARDWYLESADRADSTEPTAVGSAAVAAGFEARVVRRFVDSEGWRYVARVEGFADGASAAVAAHSLADSTGVALVVLSSDGDAVTRIADVVPSGAIAPAPVAPEADSDAEMASIVKAQGSVAGTLARLQAGPVRFEFRREMPDGTVVDHRWGAQGGSLYCEIAPVSGKAVASKTRVVGEAAVLSVAGGEWSRQNGPKARQALSSLGPSEVIPLVLALADALPDRKELQDLKVAGAGKVDGVATRILRYDGDATTGPLQIEVGVQDHLLRRAEFEDGALVYEFSDYRTEAGMKVPHQVVTERDGALVDRVLVSKLQLGADLPAEWFAPIK